MPNQVTILRELRTALEQMLNRNEKITARAVIASMGGVLKHPSDITRNTSRNELFVEYQKMQRHRQASLTPGGRRSIVSLEVELAKRLVELEQCKSDKNLLIASHRAAILAVGELGGANAWLKFFEGYHQLLSRLSDLDAVPSVVPIKRDEESGSSVPGPSQ
jgi:hypothetical protein